MVLKIADRIKYSREKNNLTQTELAKKLAVTRSSVNAWEMGITIPSTERLAELTKVLNVSADFLLGIDDSEKISLADLNETQKHLVYELINIFK
ncbi:MAG: helix-turn-helix domain-containing protein, partial [Clostridiales bacterium]|nr:helix-turn-helix domain-containing protein [Clostridiales bacterium]